MAQLDRNSERTSSVTLDRGLYALRYASAGNGTPPIVDIKLGPGSESLVTVVLAPGETAPRLLAPGTACVLVSQARSSVDLTVRSRGGGSLQASLKLEPLHDAARPSEPITPVSQMEAPRLVCHVPRKGDVETALGHWIGGPQAPTPIEGVLLQLPGMDVEYQVLVQGTARWSQWTAGGTYAGTRGRARPLAGIRLRLNSRGTPGELKASALFLGSGIIERQGMGVELVSAAGTDPLVGLKLELSTTHYPAEGAAAPDSAAVGQDRKSRVRVFRAGVEQR